MKIASSLLLACLSFTAPLANSQTPQGSAAAGSAVASSDPSLNDLLKRRSREVDALFIALAAAGKRAQQVKGENRECGIVLVDRESKYERYVTGWYRDGDVEWSNGHYFNDLVAVGALQACDELKCRVPQDLAIIGHDDIPVAALVSPTLTTCRVPRYELGARAVNALLERLRDNPADCSQIVLQPQLVIRESAP